MDAHSPVPPLTFRANLLSRAPFAPSGSCEVEASPAQATGKCPWGKGFLRWVNSELQVKSNKGGSWRRGLPGTLGPVKQRQFSWKGASKELHPFLHRPVTARPLVFAICTCWSPRGLQGWGPGGGRGGGRGAAGRRQGRLKHHVRYFHRDSAAVLD